MHRYAFCLALLATGCLVDDLSPGADPVQGSVPVDESLEVPEAASLVYDESGVYPYYVWEEVGGTALPADLDGFAIYTNEQAAADHAPAGDWTIEDLSSEPSEGDADTATVEVGDDDEYSFHMEYAGTGTPPPGASTSPTKYGIGYVKVRVSGGSVTSTFYYKSTSGSSWATLYGPTTYSSCTYAYNCSYPYAMYVYTTWSTGSRTLTFTTSTSSCSPSC